MAIVGHKAITITNADVLLVGPLGATFFMEEKKYEKLKMSAESCHFVLSLCNLVV